MVTNTPLCNFAQSKALKELGFDWGSRHATWMVDMQNGNGPQPHTSNQPDLDNWNKLEGIYSQPTLDQALRWFRKVKGVHGWVESEYLFDEWKYRWSYRSLGDLYSLPIPVLDHDEAQSALVSRIIEILNETKG